MLFMEVIAVYSYKLVNVVHGNNRSLFLESYETHKYTVGKMQSY
jgi:hypothetical protein